MRVVLRKWGNSAAVRLPAAIAKAALRVTSISKPSAPRSTPRKRLSLMTSANPSAVRSGDGRCQARRPSAFACARPHKQPIDKRFQTKWTPVRRPKARQRKGPPWSP